jgi:hypothetical protein
MRYVGQRGDTLSVKAYQVYNVCYNIPFVVPRPPLGTTGNGLQKVEGMKNKGCGTYDMSAGEPY